MSNVVRVDFRHKQSTLMDELIELRQELSRVYRATGGKLNEYGRRIQDNIRLYEKELGL